MIDHELIDHYENSMSQMLASTFPVLLLEPWPSVCNTPTL